MTRFYRETGYLGIGLLISGVAGLLFNIILGRVLPGDGYGVFRIFFSAALFAGWIISFGVERQVTSQVSGGQNNATSMNTAFTALLTLSAVFFLVATVLRPVISPQLIPAQIYRFFLGATIFFASHRVFIGVLKGFRWMHLVAMQNVVTGAVKLGIAGVTAWFAFTVPFTTAAVVAMFAATTALSVYWLRHRFPRLRFCFPGQRYWAAVGFSTVKQVGDVAVRFGGPLLIPVIGGTAFDAGVYAALFQIAIIPYYGYRALIQTMLPEVSALHSEEDMEGISRRVSFLTEVTVIGLVPWTAAGYVFGPWLLTVLFKPSFQISPGNAALIFFFCGLLLLAALFTEVLIGVNGERAVAWGWLLPVPVAIMVLFLPGSAVARTAWLFTVYMTGSTILLGYGVTKNKVSFQFTGLDHTVFASAT